MKEKRKIQHVEYTNFVQNNDRTGTFDIIKLVKFMTDSQKLDLIINKIKKIDSKVDALEIDIENVNKKLDRVIKLNHLKN
ncbi:hypothetical protein FACS1894166_04950 [Bacilli bacterium]|nr:hypothetical protein FACS1894166_04950 [Bacilli bacterium]